MRKFILSALMLATLGTVNAQVDTSKTLLRAAEAKKTYQITNRAGDHLMVQLAMNQWMGTPDSIDSHIGGFQRSANVYVMMDKTFKSNPQFSVALGLGIGTSNIYFKKMEVDIKSTSPVLPFVATDSMDNFKKYKLSTAFLELPLELRFTAKPETPMKSVKAALGLKVGTLLNAHTKGKNLRNKSGQAINSYTLKESSRSYFTTTRLAATARVGYGNFTLFGAYHFTPVFKDGVAEDIKLLQFGLTLSGL